MPTVLEVIQSTTGYFEKHGVESPRLNAEHLVAHALGRKKRLELYLEFDRPLTETELAPMRELVRSRARGVPLQHLLGTVEFLGREFRCDARALVPRPETEQLVELALPVRESTPAPRILDVGTGSGVIAITLALEIPGASVTAIDISPDALALARENADLLGATVRFEEGNLLPEEGAPFHLIVANLPYIPSEEIPTLSREVQHDPKTALDGGPDGLNLVRTLADRARSRLQGRLHLEIGHDQAPAVAHLLEEKGYRDIVVTKDYAGIDRFVSASI
jgi:protein-(glutamine-N5) methyltransferase, release factor-specific